MKFEKIDENVKFVQLFCLASSHRISQMKTRHARAHVTQPHPAELENQFCDDDDGAKDDDIVHTAHSILSLNYNHI